MGTIITSYNNNLYYNFGTIINYNYLCLNKIGMNAVQIPIREYRKNRDMPEGGSTILSPFQISRIPITPNISINIFTCMPDLSLLFITSENINTIPKPHITESKVMASSKG